MTLEQLEEVVSRATGRASVEASGRVNLETIGAIAETGVDFVSVGALTHSARALDLSLLLYS
jgi:nicotinate-nucleotide pyrophosphorylase (carboxylating)